MALARKLIDGLDFLLHGAEVLDLVLDPGKRLAVLTIAPTTTPKAGPIPTKANISLGLVSAMAVVLRDRQGKAPDPGMEPVRIDQLGGLARGRHPLPGWDFIDNGWDSIPSGQVVFEWFDPTLPGSEHTLSFFYGVRSAEGAAALLLFLIFFDSARATHPDGSEINVERFAAVGPGWKAVNLGQGTGLLEPVTILPDAVPPKWVDGQVLGLIFVDAATDAIVGYAVGKASWDGRSLRWSTSEEVTYDIPDSLARQIRPRIPNMNRSGEPLEGFSYFALVAVSPDVSSNSPELVRHYLERSKSV